MPGTYTLLLAAWAISIKVISIESVAFVDGNGFDLLNAVFHRAQSVEAVVSRYKRIIAAEFRSRNIAGQRTESKIGCSILHRMAQLAMPNGYMVG